MAKSNGIIYSSVKSPQHPKLYSTSEGVDICRQRNKPFSMLRLKFFNKALRHGYGKLSDPSFLCRSTEMHNTETKECTRSYDDYSDISSLQDEDEHPARPQKSTPSGQGLAEACRFAYNDAKFMNERARSDIVLLSRGYLSLHSRNWITYRVN